MILNQPTKEIIFEFSNLSDSNRENVKNFLTGLKQEYKFIFSVEDTEFIISSDELDALNEVYNDFFAFSMKKGLKFEVMFKCTWKITTEKEALGYMDVLFNKPTEEEYYMCIDTSFIYGREGIFFLVNMGITGNNEVTISMMDSIKDSDEIGLKYDAAVIATHKIIKY